MSATSTRVAISKWQRVHSRGGVSEQRKPPWSLHRPRPRSRYSNSCYDWSSNSDSQPATRVPRDFRHRQPGLEKEIVDWAVTEMGLWKRNTEHRKGSRRKASFEMAASTEFSKRLAVKRPNNGLAMAQQLKLSKSRTDWIRFDADGISWFKD